jgi:hypothetical protein
MRPHAKNPRIPEKLERSPMSDEVRDLLTRLRPLKDVTLKHGLKPK